MNRISLKLDVTHSHTYCAAHTSANTRAHQLHWSDQHAQWYTACMQLKSLFLQQW